MRKTDKFTFFWLTEDVFSNWHPAEFVDEHSGLVFSCSEQYMMRGKALLFGDVETAKKIMKAKTPREQKKLGREVKGFDMDVWKLHAKRIVLEACYLKFTQNDEMYDALLATDDTVLVEASPSDMLWGIGMKESDEGVEDPKNWKGENWLGEVLNMLKGVLRVSAEAKTYADDLDWEGPEVKVPFADVPNEFRDDTGGYGTEQQNWTGRNISHMGIQKQSENAYRIQIGGFGYNLYPNSPKQFRAAEKLFKKYHQKEKV